MSIPPPTRRIDPAGRRPNGWWQLLTGPEPLLIRLLYWSQRNARADTAEDRHQAEDHRSDSRVAARRSTALPRL